MFFTFWFGIDKIIVKIYEHLQWEPQIQHVNNKLAKNVGKLIS